MTEPLSKKSCVPCKGAVPPLIAKEILPLCKELSKDWKVVNYHHLHRLFRFTNFAEALAFVNKVGAIAESEGHHPDMILKWGLVEITLFTHKINGLTESDFILAAKIDELD